MGKTQKDVKRNFQRYHSGRKEKERLQEKQKQNLHHFLLQRRLSQKVVRQKAPTQSAQKLKTCQK